jgi:putative ABC transport system permease protein
LFEAIILSVIGGIGLLLVWIISLILTNALDFEFVLSAGNIILGTGLAAIIGFGNIASYFCFKTRSC